MKKYQIPGAAIVFVENNRIVFAQGYGWANLQKHIAVNPRRTVFRVASVTKLFTTVAVLQLAEQGKLHLHTDINRYIKDFQIHRRYPEAVSLAELLTHTAGFEDLSIGVAVHQPDELEPLGSYLAHHMPAQIYPPGKIISYSNHGMALAGYIVQTVSGVPYADYVQKNILGPLEMRRAGFLPSGRLERDLATGYGRWRRLHPVPLDYFNIQPASGLCSTPADMARFIMAMLAAGRYRQARILSASSVARMERQQFTQDPRLPGRAYGFYEKQFDGLRVIGHGGDVRGFGGLLTLVPEKHLGFFIATNVDEPRFDETIERRFFQRFFPAPRVPLTQALNNPRDAARVAGSYRLNPYSATTFAKLFTLYWQYRVTANPDGSIELNYPHRYHRSSRWVEVQPLLYERLGTGDRMVFHADRTGHITEMFTNEEAFNRLPSFAAAGFQVRFVECLLMIFISVLILWPAEALWRLRRRLPSYSHPDRTAPQLARGSAVVLALLVLIFVISFLATIDRMDLWDFAYGIPPRVQELLFIPPVTVVLAAAVTALTVIAWFRRWWSLLDRIHFTVVAGAGLAWVWFVYYWRLLYP